MAAIEHPTRIRAGLTRLIFAVFLVFHGVAHLVGTTDSFERAADGKTVEYLGGLWTVSDPAVLRVLGVAWALAAAAYLVVAWALWVRARWRLAALVAATAPSLIRPSPGCGRRGSASSSTSYSWARPSGCARGAAGAWTRLPCERRRVTTMTVLVAYASKHGSTEGIARCIAERLRERGMEAEARPIDDVTDLGNPEAIILGSAVYMGSWMKDASAFVERHRETLSRIPVWLFSSGPTGTAPTEVGVSEKQLAALQPIAPRDHRLFYGALDPSKLGFLERKMVKAVKAPVGDFRDWDEIRAFADEIAHALS